MSRKLVMLDDKVKLDVPIDDLAVHEPDCTRLIAFLKAMEFSSLTRRVAEFADIDTARSKPMRAVARRRAHSPASGQAARPNPREPRAWRMGAGAAGR